MNITLVTARSTDLDRPADFIVAGLAAAFPAGLGVEVVAEVLGTITAQPRPAPWGAYWAVRRDSPRAVGLCAFKSAPDAEQDVEIAYYTFPAMEGRGVATAMAAALADIASGGAARSVIAKTLPVESASGAVLRRNGFEFIGPAKDPDDGLVWAWRKTLD